MKIINITLAVRQMDLMLNFYSKIFYLDFKEKELYGFKLYVAFLGEIEIQFCPAELARNTATQNRHQFEVLVDDIHNTVALVESNGGTLMGEINVDQKRSTVGIEDPDGNSLVITELK